ncbi:Protein of unknown function [Microbulbifer thermotolerans]|uniref:type III-A CRISPR-associated protein Csm2 n=1 Tax=Microbulbifer thermotolerans TaxID=252514 RepID=UPI0008EBAEBF|nr:type III-A CRISPR-associated protein Csm2 [Microbulbifer thermotolerans]MCX2796427.1 type III-A CRISPR-associated protein Csm2 [Microbulbifer thermotolerans]SFD09924.1 Protein of unknown function [Microbulbifer thermotolerans]
MIKENSAEPEVQLQALTAELLSTTADQWAQIIADEAKSEADDNNRNGKNKRKGKKDINKSTQLRRFYDEICRLHDKGERDFERRLPFVHMILSKVAYAKSRDLVGEKFYQLMQTCLRQVENWQTFDNFKHFMEAFMGFYRMYRPQ